MGCLQVVDAADVLCFVLDARDPMGTRCKQLERALPKTRLAHKRGMQAHMNMRACADVCDVCIWCSKAYVDMHTYICTSARHAVSCKQTATDERTAEWSGRPHEGALTHRLSHSFASPAPFARPVAWGAHFVTCEKISAAGPAWLPLAAEARHHARHARHACHARTHNWYAV